MVHHNSILIHTKHSCIAAKLLHTGINELQAGSGCTTRSQELTFRYCWKLAFSSTHQYSTRATTRRSMETLYPAPFSVTHLRLRSLHLKKFHGSKRCQALPRRLTILLPRANFFAKLFAMALCLGLHATDRAGNLQAHHNFTPACQWI